MVALSFQSWKSFQRTFITNIVEVLHGPGSEGVAIPKEYLLPYLAICLRFEVTQVKSIFIHKLHLTGLRILFIQAWLFSKEGSFGVMNQNVDDVAVIIMSML